MEIAEHTRITTPKGPTMNTRRRPVAAKRKRTVAATAGLSTANNPTGLLLLMGLFLFAISGAYWYSNDMGFNIKVGSLFLGGKAELSDATRNALSKRRVNRKFVMGGVYLGMTQEMVQAIHPDAQVGVDRRGESVITIPTDKGIMVAWLHTNGEVVKVGGKAVRDDAKRIYRLRLDEAFADLSEEDILTRYGRTYGRPLETTCARTGLGGSARCAYRWWGGDGIELQASAKKKTDLDGRIYTQLTTVATNTIKSPKKSAVRLSSIALKQRLGALN